MSDIAIRVENLSKRYRMGQYVGSGAQYRTLRESLTNAVSAPLRRLRQGESARPKTVPPSPVPGPPSPTPGQPSTNRFLWALRDVSFEVKRGEVLGIIGRNGAGKSTLLKVLTSITEPTEGRVELNGRVGSLLEVGTGFHPELTGRENIYLSGAILGMTRKETDWKFDEIVDFSGVEAYIDTPVKRYSSGMRVRLGFAVAAHLEPEILLIDEVLAVGDAEFQKKCLGKMGDVASEGRTVLFVSHNMGAIQRLCPQAIWLEEGAVNEIGDSAVVCEKYLYLDTGFGSGVYAFDDGAQHAVQFLRAELLNSQEKRTSTFRADEPIKFRITYRLTRDFSGLSVALNITGALGGSLWGVSDLDCFPELFEKRQQGAYVYECIAPANVLRPGTYKLALGAGSGSQYFHHPTPFPFEINTVGYWRQSHRYFGVAGGPIVVPMKAKMPVLVEEVSS